MKVGIIGCSEIAFRRFMPAVKRVKDIEVVAVAEEFDPSKLDNFCDEYNVEGIKSFDELLERMDIDSIYVPQPPALHYKWAKKALLAGKHVLIEKPSTVSLQQSSELVDLAKQRKLVLHENYMFQYNRLIEEVKKCLKNKEIGEIRLIRANFGFPLRTQNDFRYIKNLGGGALMYAAGYPVKLATLLLGQSIKVDSATINHIDGYEVDMYGSASFSNNDGCVCQIGYGMDCQYQCNLEVWGNRGKMFVDRIFTTPPDYEPVISITRGNDTEIINIKSDSHFQHSIEKFLWETKNDLEREQMYEDILLQAKLIEDIRRLAIE